MPSKQKKTQKGVNGGQQKPKDEKPSQQTPSQKTKPKSDLQYTPRKEIVKTPKEMVDTPSMQDSDIRGLIVDPWRAVANDRKVSEKDTCDIAFTSQRCQSESIYTELVPEAGNNFRLFWIPPLVHVNSEGKEVQDNRGNFVKWLGVKFDVENKMSDGELIFKGTTPSTLEVGLDYAGKTHVRSGYYDFGMKEGMMKGRNYNYADHKNLVAPTVCEIEDPKRPGMKIPAIALMDFTFIKTNVGELARNDHAAVLHVESRYEVETSSNRTGILEERMRFALVDIHDTHAIYHLDPIITPDYVTLSDGTVLPDLHEGPYDLLGERPKFPGGSKLMRYKNLAGSNLIGDYSKVLENRAAVVGKQFHGGKFNDMTRWVERKTKSTVTVII